MKFAKVALVVALTVVMGACSSVAKTQGEGSNAPTAVSSEARAAAVDADATFVTEVTFAKGSSDLDQVERSKLEELVRRARNTGEIDDIKVITWADREYPAKRDPNWNKTQKNLAADRADRISKAMHAEDKSLDVDTFNMAERPGVLSRLFNTENARVKKSLEVAGIATTDNNKIPHKAGKSMVMVILK